MSRYIDLVFCMVVLPVMALIFPIERWFHNFPWFVSSVGVWLYSLYFLNRLITVPFIYGNRQKKLISLALIVLSVVAAFGFSNIGLYTPKPNIHDQGITRVLPYIQPYQQAVWSLFMIVEAFSFAVGLLTQANLQRSRRREVEAERDKAEIALYKAQIKPHFMFNTLNSLYGLFLTENEAALPSLERFITMMRYIHQSSHCDMIPLSDEVDYIRQYVGLQSLRLNGMTKVAMTIDVGSDDLMIPPMLLVTFVENCFKHGVSSVEHSTIDISITEHNGKMAFMTANHIFTVRHIGEHMGIDNCRRRLELQYPSRHSLIVDNDGSIFKVELTMELNND
ncbi:MAG: histidine kinase [Muribaculaceae bacterium]|nr:histidine kinase [Muribaculaceae bacterium]